ncbi:MAG: bifunctional precorrin-2 dehydrogenase/sirohydrochlorin ferrochelatase [Phascolarctobacterium sp.]|nr:bifunctional precorrin-2 dehydrogenase/sirohydrochlorin ferrochelatase [Phascolarctobacterium sp.]
MLIENNFHYPVILKLTGKKCVIIGGGEVAARKLNILCEAGAKVTIVAPEFCDLLQKAARKYQCQLINDCYNVRYLQQAFIVIAATNDKAVNRQITTDAPLLCNNITEPELSNFTVPSSFTQGDITVALATGGMPAFTRMLKKRLQEVITPDIAAFNDFLRQQRHIVQQIPSTPAQRTTFWRQILTDDLINLVAAGHAAQAKENILDAISSFRSQSQNGPR